MLGHLPQVSQLLSVWTETQMAPRLMLLQPHQAMAWGCQEGAILHDSEPGARLGVIWRLTSRRRWDLEMRFLRQPVLTQYESTKASATVWLGGSERLVKSELILEKEFPSVLSS